MKHWTIGKRVALGIVILTLMVAGVGGLGFVGLKNTITQAQSITQQTKDHGRFLAESINLARSAQVNFKKQVQEWKDTLLRGNDPATFKKYSDQFAQREAAVDQNLASLQKLFAGAGVETKLVDQSLVEHQKLGGQYRAALKAYDSAQTNSCFVVDKLVQGIDRPATDAIDGIVQQVQQFEADTTQATEKHFREQTARMQTLVLLGLVTGVVFAVGFGWVLVRSLRRQLSHFAENLGGNSQEVAAAAMGFAVVADEVRNLAQRSAQAAKETAAKIEGAIRTTAQGVTLSGKVAQALNDIVTKARQVDELAAEVAGASREQTQGITQINVAVGQMDKVTQSNSAGAEESAAAAEELNAQAEVLKQSVSELLQLVGGNQERGGQTTVRPGANPPPTSALRVLGTSAANGHPPSRRCRREN